MSEKPILPQDTMKPNPFQKGKPVKKEKKEMVKPAVGEKCELCGQVMK